MINMFPSSKLEDEQIIDCLQIKSNSFKSAVCLRPVNNPKWSCWLPVSIVRIKAWNRTFPNLVQPSDLHPEVCWLVCLLSCPRCSLSSCPGIHPTEIKSINFSAALRSEDAHTLRYTLSHTLAPALTHTLSQSHTHSLSHTHSHTHRLSLCQVRA